MTDIHSERLTKQNVHQNLSQISNFSTRISVLLSRLYVHWGNFGLEDSTLIVVALVLPSSPSLSLASQTLSGVWLARLGPFHEIEGGRSTAAAHAQNLVRSETKVRPKKNLPGPGTRPHHDHSKGVQLSRDQHMVFHVIRHLSYAYTES